MKLRLICLLLMTVLSSVVLSQEDSLQSVIRILEKKESVALAKGDIKTLYSIWDVAFVLDCNALTIPLRRIKETLTQIKFKYDYPTRNFTIYFIDANTAVVMGDSREQYITIPPNANQPQAQFTDVWSKHTGDWKLCTRQVTCLK